MYDEAMPDAMIEYAKGYDNVIKLEVYTDGEHDAVRVMDSILTCVSKSGLRVRKVLSHNPLKYFAIYGYYLYETLSIARTKERITCEKRKYVINKYCSVEPYFDEELFEGIVRFSCYNMHAQRFCDEILERIIYIAKINGWRVEHRKRHGDYETMRSDIIHYAENHNYGKWT